VLNLTLQPSTFLTAIDSFNADDDIPITNPFPTTNSYTTIPPQNSALVRIYAVNYNVLRIMSGMGGLSYSN
jgi:hypothetical protein